MLAINNIIMFHLVEMTKDLCLEIGDTVIWEPARGPNNVRIAHITVEKKHSGVTTPMRQGTIHVPMVDTAQGADTSAAHAVAGANVAPPSGAARAGRKRTFRTMEESEKRPAKISVQRRQVELPAPGDVPRSSPPHVATAPASAVAAGTTAPATTGPSFKREFNAAWFSHFQSLEPILSRHGVPASTIKAFKLAYFYIAEEKLRHILDVFVHYDEANDRKEVHTLAYQLEKDFEGMKNKK
jgi:hypothetical protein